MKKLLVHPALDSQRQQALASAAPRLHIAHISDPGEAEEEIRLAEGFLGKLTPGLLRQAERLTWVQAMTASLEHYLFPALIEHPAVLTNMRGLFSDVVADHVLGLVLCFARNLHVYIRQQQQGLWAPCGGEDTRADFVTGPGVTTSMDRAHRHLADQTLCVVGLGGIGRETARRASLLGMKVLAVDPRPADATSVDRMVKSEDVDSVLPQSDFVVLAAPHTPHTQGWWNRERFQAMKPGSFLINVGRGAIVNTDAPARRSRFGSLGRGRLGRRRARTAAQRRLSMATAQRDHHASCRGLLAANRRTSLANPVRERPPVPG